MTYKCAVCEKSILMGQHVIVDATKPLGMKIDFHVQCAPFVDRGWKPESEAEKRLKAVIYYLESNYDHPTAEWALEIATGRG